MSEKVEGASFAGCAGGGGEVGFAGGVAGLVTGAVGADAGVVDFGGAAGTEEAGCAVGFVVLAGAAGFDGGGGASFFSSGSAVGGGGGGERTLTPPVGRGGAWVDVACANADPATRIVARAIETRPVIYGILP